MQNMPTHETTFRIGVTVETKIRNVFSPPRAYPNSILSPKEIVSQSESGVKGRVNFATREYTARGESGGGVASASGHSERRNPQRTPRVRFGGDFRTNVRASEVSRRPFQPRLRLQTPLSRLLPQRGEADQACIRVGLRPIVRTHVSEAYAKEPGEDHFYPQERFVRVHIRPDLGRGGGARNQPPPLLSYCCRWSAALREDIAHSEVCGGPLPSRAGAFGGQWGPFNATRTLGRRSICKFYDLGGIRTGTISPHAPHVSPECDGRGFLFQPLRPLLGGPQPKHHESRNAERRGELSPSLCSTPKRAFP
mmetsp:Transcript_2149/g.5954  ORF Transcript_2149/g.5954 Transcript_2149/m.5954 type:complete len:308 (+) Transcript_2149:241-1164(+)